MSSGENIIFAVAGGCCNTQSGHFNICECKLTCLKCGRLFKIEISDKLDSHVQVTSFEFMTLHVNKRIKNFRNLFHLKIYVRRLANIETKKPQN